MCRSHFGEQHGDFELVLVSLRSRPLEKQVVGFWSRLRRWFAVASWSAWFEGWTGGDKLKRRGAVRLADEEK